MYPFGLDIRYCIVLWYIHLCESVESVTRLRLFLSLSKLIVCVLCVAKITVSTLIGRLIGPWWRVCPTVLFKEHCRICTLTALSTIIAPLPQNSHSLIVLFSVPILSVPLEPVVTVGDWQFCLCSLCLLWLADCYGLWLPKIVLLFFTINYSLVWRLLGLRHFPLHVPSLLLQLLHFRSYTLY